jgi:hypothetical protein
MINESSSFNVIRQASHTHTNTHTQTHTHKHTHTHTRKPRVKRILHIHFCENLWLRQKQMLDDFRHAISGYQFYANTKHCHILLLRLTFQLTSRRSQDDKTIVNPPPPPPPPGYRYVLEVWILGLQMLRTLNVFPLQTGFRYVLVTLRKASLYLHKCYR